MGIAIRGMESEQSVDQQVCETTAVADCSCGRVDPVRLSGASQALCFGKPAGFSGNLIRENVRTNHQRGVVRELTAVNLAFLFAADANIV